jgi:hypothetical protein
MEFKSGQSYVGYCTKYALSKGIAPTTAKVGGNPKYATSIGGGLGGVFMVIGRDFFIDKEEAEARARQMAINKKKSLARQMAEMSELAVTPKYITK